MKKVAIIGGGAAGLSCLKSLLEVGIEPMLFEKSSKIGGLWNYDESLPDGGGPTYASLITNTSKYMMAFSDFSFKQEIEDFPKRSDVLDYLNEYSNEFGLLPFIRLNTEVINIVKQQNYVLRYKKNNNYHEEEFDWIIIANGRNEKTVVPKIKGIDNFQGEIVHSKAYRNPESFNGKRVLVVGSASSAMDIVSEISNVCLKTVLSVRNKSWLVPRYIEGKAYDLHLTKIKALLPKTIRENAFRNKLIKAYSSFSDLNIKNYYGDFLPNMDLEKNRFVPNDNLLKKRLEKQIEIKPEIRSISEYCVVFNDNSSAEFDCIIFATGYQMDFSFLNISFTNQNNNYIPLYDQVFSPTIANLAFVGMCYIVGPILPALEMQSRYISQVISGSKKLPSKTKMLRKVEQYKMKCTKKNLDPMRVQTLYYLDSIAKKLRVKPLLWKNLTIIRFLLMGPIVPARFRLNGSFNKKKLAQKIVKKMQV